MKTPSPPRAMLTSLAALSSLLLACHSDPTTTPSPTATAGSGGNVAVGGASGSSGGGASGSSGGGASSGGENHGGSGSGGQNSSGMSGKSGSSGHPDACQSLSCDDGLECTLDGCKDGKCTHAVGPNQGQTACPAGQFCTVEKGCVAAPVCANDQQCSDFWKSDPCKANPRCDAASSVCLFDLLDKDGDGHAPLVCGGDDCDDGDKSRYPKATELCDGKDNDCDGIADQKAKCPSSSGIGEDPLRSCVAGTCQCKSEFLCGTTCTDKQSDDSHCGTCDNACEEGAFCKEGSCVCKPGFTKCGDVCVDLKTDPAHCGACDNDCAKGAGAPYSGAVSCSEATCRCASSGGLACFVECNGGDICWPTTPPVQLTCVSLDDKENCGACGKSCPAGAECVGGACECPPQSPSCGGDTCLDLSSTWSHCGACGNQCAATETCVGGTCTPCPAVCGGVCTDLGTDQHCSSCGDQCAPHEFCFSGACVDKTTFICDSGCNSPCVVCGFPGGMDCCSPGEECQPEQGGCVAPAGAGGSAGNGGSGGAP